MEVAIVALNTYRLPYVRYFDDNDGTNGNELWEERRASGTVMVKDIAPSSEPSAGPLMAVTVSAGNFHTCAVLDNGDLKCWGGNYYGQLWKSDGTAPTHLHPHRLTSAMVVPLIAVSAYYDWTCAILDNGDVNQRIITGS